MKIILFLFINTLVLFSCKTHITMHEDPTRSLIKKIIAGNNYNNGNLNTVVLVNSDFLYVEDESIDLSQSVNVNKGLTTNWNSFSNDLNKYLQEKNDSIQNLVIENPYYYLNMGINFKQLSNVKNLVLTGNDVDCIDSNLINLLPQVEQQVTFNNIYTNKKLVRKYFMKSKKIRFINFLKLKKKNCCEI